MGMRWQDLLPILAVVMLFGCCYGVLGSEEASRLLDEANRLRDNGQERQSLSVYSRARDAVRDWKLRAEIDFNKGYAFMKLNRQKEGRDEFLRVLLSQSLEVLKGKEAPVRVFDALYSILYTCDFRYHRVINRAIELIIRNQNESVLLGIRPVEVLYSHLPESSLQRVFRAHGNQVPEIRQSPDFEHSYRGRKSTESQPLRVGVLLTYYLLESHNVGLALRSLLEETAKLKEESYLFLLATPESCDNPNRQVGIQQAVKGAHLVLDLTCLSDAEALSVMQSYQLDVVVDANIGVEGSRPSIAVSLSRVVPTVGAIGVSHSTGSSRLHSFVLDRYVVPPSRIAIEFTESALYMPSFYQATHFHWSFGRNASPRTHNSRGGDISRANYGLPSTASVVFCNLNTLMKSDVDHYDAMASIVNGVEGSVLWLFENPSQAVPELTSYLKSQLHRENSLIFAPLMDYYDNLDRLPLCDLFLDSYPVSSQTVAADVLWSGVPLLARAGSAFRSRVAASLNWHLRFKGVGENYLIADSVSEFVEKGIALGRNPVALSHIKQQLLAARSKTRVYGPSAFAKGWHVGLEIMREMWEHFSEDDTWRMPHIFVVKQPRKLW